MKKLSLYVLPVMMAAVTVGCASGRRSSSGGEVTGVGGSSFAEPTPYGMVLVSRGSMEMGPQKADSAWNINCLLYTSDAADE